MSDSIKHSSPGPSLVTLPPTQNRIELSNPRQLGRLEPRGQDRVREPLAADRPMQTATRQHRFKGNTKGLGAVTACSLAPAWPHLRRSAIAR